MLVGVSTMGNSLGTLKFHGFPLGNMGVEAERLIEEGWVPRIKTVRGHRYITLRKGGEERSLGAYTQRARAKVLKIYMKKLIGREVSPEDLLIAKRLSMHPHDYAHNVFQAIAATQLIREGLDVSAGQTVRYLITDANNSKPNRRVRVAELVDNKTTYDVRKYLELLLEAGTNILSPFGYSVEKLYDTIINNEIQAHLSIR
jgi:DNA polymerase elongation subunit (family B)